MNRDEVGNEYLANQVLAAEDTLPLLPYLRCLKD